MKKETKKKLIIGLLHMNFNPLYDKNYFKKLGKGEIDLKIESIAEMIVNIEKLKLD